LPVEVARDSTTEICGLEQGEMAGNPIRRKESRRLAHATAVLLALLALLGIGAASAAGAITLEAPPPGSRVADSTPAFGGATDDLVDEVTLDIYAGSAVDGGAVVQTLTSASPPIGGTWSLEPTTPLADGTYTAQASQTSGMGETSSSEPPVTFAVDTTPPAVQLSPVASPTNDSTPSFSGAAGTAEGDIGPVTLKIYAGTGASGSPIATLSATPHSGSWTATASEALGDGTYTAQAEQSDEAGNTGTSSASTFTVDTAAPAVSLSPVSSPASDSTPSFSGGAGTADGDRAEVIVEIFAGTSATGSPVRTIAASPLGSSWSATVAEALADGTYTVRAAQSDQAGNAATSAPSTFTVDTTPPAPQITSPASGSFLNSTKPVLSGSAGSAGGDQATVTVKVYGGSSASGNPLQEVSVSRSGGSWTTGSSGPQLLEGTYTIQAEQADQAGNVGESATSTFTIKTKGPAVSLTAPAARINDPTPSFGGAAGTAAGDFSAVTLKLYSGTSASGSPVRTVHTTASAGSWAATVGEALKDGTYTAQSEQSDSAGNTSRSAPSTFTLDTIAPSVSLLPGASERHTSTPQFEGGAGVAAGDTASVTLKIYAGAGISGSPVRSVSATLSGGKWKAAPSAALANGHYTAQAEQSDEAGNTGRSAPAEFTINSKGPIVTLAPVAGETNDATPSFSGTAGVATGDIPSIRLKIYGGPVAAASEPVREVVIAADGGSWTSGPVEALADGQYTVLAEQSNELGNTGVSGEATFTLDTHPPAVTISAPANGSSAVGGAQLVEGGAGTAPGDSSTIAVRLFSGSSPAPGALLQTRVVQAVSGQWKVPFEGLAPGTYAVQAEQSDEAANTGHSEAPAFTLLAPGAGASAAQPPASSFTWSPTAPHAGEVVSLLSSSTDQSSPIVSFAWDLAGNGAFAPGPAAITTSFATPGNHAVRLSVTAADGLSSVATETIPVGPARAALMDPFPIVRIASSDTKAGIRLRLLKVQAPAGAGISVLCRGRGCPLRSQRRVATPAKSGPPTYRFRSFERRLRAGVVLEVRIAKAGVIGKYTRLVVRRGKLPQRVDECLDPGGAKPIVCPA
jgi:Big-like domain-containing protein/PKD domain-containing protein